MDNTKAVLAGTIARGLLWGMGIVAQKLGVQALGEDTINAVALFAAGCILEIGAIVWSMVKNRKIAERAAE